jgi:hypothetical protein
MIKQTYETPVYGSTVKASEAGAKGTLTVSCLPEKESGQSKTIFRQND